MTRCRLHVFHTDDEVPEGHDDLKAAFDELFTESEAFVQTNTEEWVSAVFVDSEENLARVDAFEQRCREIHPGATVLRTRQHRDRMDGRAEEFGYEEAIMLTVTHDLV